MKYHSVLMTPKRALLHYMIYFSMADDKLTEGESEALAAYRILFKTDDSLNFTEELSLFVYYKGDIESNKIGYLNYLIKHIGVDFINSLYMIAMDLALSDNEYSEDEVELFEQLATWLDINDLHKKVLQQAIIGKHLLKINLQ